jgi:hypothetical protein
MTAPKTTTARKTTPAVDTKPTEPVATAPKTRSAAVDIDLSKLTATKAPAPVVGSGAGRKAEDNTVAEGWLRESWSERAKDGNGAYVGKLGGGRALTVPTNAAGTVISKLRRAAKSLDLGLRVQATEADGKTSIAFAASQPKNTKNRQAATAPVAPVAPVETPAAK